VRFGDEPPSAGAAARAEPVDDVEAELDQTGTEVAPPAVLHQSRANATSARAHAYCCASPSLSLISETVSLRLGRKQLEDVERPIGRLDRRRNVTRRPRTTRRVSCPRSAESPGLQIMT
jgi:hypothetical protein